MSKKLSDIKWKSVAIDGFPADMIDKFQGFGGLEECTDYGFDKEKKSQKKIKEKPKRKNPDQENENVSSKKQKLNNSGVSKKVPQVQLPTKKSKKIQLDNGFIVEECTSEKPTLKHMPIDTKPSNNKGEKKMNNTTASLKPKKKEVNKKEKKKEVKKKEVAKKVKLGETIVESGLTIEDMQAWSALQIPEEILKALAEQGFQNPTRIQELTLPSAMLGRRDILGAAETGSGKTLAFGIPILSGIMKLKEKAAAGVDVYDLQYKKSSTKKIKETPAVEPKTKHKKQRKQAPKKTESSEEGYSSADDVDEDNSNDNPGERDDDQESDSSEFLEEYDVPVKKKSNVDEEENDEEDGDSDEGSKRLSEMFDSDDLQESSDEGGDEGSDDDDEGVDEDETDSQNEYAEELDPKGLGCVRVSEGPPAPAPAPRSGRPLYALVLTPTRELALQVARHLTAAAKYTGIRIATLVGGLAAARQERLLAAAPELVVATPGRLWQLLQQGNQHLEQCDHIKFLAIDEADRMAERNHFEELHPLLERLNSDDGRKSSRQNFVFSATLTMVHDLPTHMKGKKVTKRGKIIHRKISRMTVQEKVGRLAALVGLTAPKVVDVTADNLGTADTLTESRILCPLEQKDCHLYYILRSFPARTIVFCNSIGSVRRLASLFTLLKCNPLPLHASMPQRQRLKNLERFRDDPRGVLVATDVAARGLDVPGVAHVVHYQVPRTAENYVHRSGRTARANTEGLTILMVEPSEAALYAKLCRTLNKTSDLPPFPVPPSSLSLTQRVVSLARDTERAQSAARRSQLAHAWLDKASREMDLIVDEDYVDVKPKDEKALKDLQIKKKQLEALLAKPVFPKGFSFKYPTLNDSGTLNPKEENALDAVKKSLKTGEIKKQKRKGRNDALLKLGKRLKQSK